MPGKTIVHRDGHELIVWRDRHCNVFPTSDIRSFFWFVRDKATRDWLVVGLGTKRKAVSAALDSLNWEMRS